MNTESPAVAEQKEVFTVEQAAAFICMSPDYVYRQSAAGEIPYVMMGRRKVFLRSSLLEWLKSREHRKE